MEIFFCTETLTVCESHVKFMRVRDALASHTGSILYGTKTVYCSLQTLAGQLCDKITKYVFYASQLPWETQ